MNKKDSPSERRELLAEKIDKDGIEVALITNPKHIYYLTGIPVSLHSWFTIMKGPRTSSFLALDAKGNFNLLTGENDWRFAVQYSKKPDKVPVTLYKDYDLTQTIVPHGNEIATRLNDWLHKLGYSFARVAIEEWNIPQFYFEVIRSMNQDAEFVDLSEVLLNMRTTKGKDEISSLTKAASMLDLAYTKAKEIARPGRTELDVYSELNSFTFRKFGMFSWIMGDYASGPRSANVGGPPTSRRMKEGETIILDLQIQYNWYWSDLCRTFLIGSNKPSKAQSQVYDVILKAIEEAEKLLAPGTTGKEIYNCVNNVIRKAGYPELPHHAGHCIGLDDQEPPWFIPGERRTLEENSVCVLEPGIYKASTGGIRLEEMYIVKKRKPVKISHFPLDISAG